MFNRVVHGTERKIFYHSYNTILYGGVKSDLVYSSAHNFTYRLIKCFYAGFIYYHRITIIEIANLEIAACNKLKLECFSKIKFYIKLIPLQLLISKFRKLD